MSRPVLVDLFCGEGGASAGLVAAGYDVIGVDNNPAALERYPYESVCAEWDSAVVLDLLRGADAAWASAPCHKYSAITPGLLRDAKPDLVDPVRRLLNASGLPWIMENVPGSPLRPDVVLCGTEFGLSVVCPDGRLRWLRRHRVFESPVFLWGAGGCSCSGRLIAGVYGTGGGGQRSATAQGGGYKVVRSDARELLGAPWMTQQGLSQAIPPAYSTFLGLQLLEASLRLPVPA